MAGKPILGMMESASGEVISRIDDVLPDLANNSGRATTAALRFTVLLPAVILVGLAGVLLAVDRFLQKKHVDDEIANLRTGIERIEAEFGGTE